MEKDIADFAVKYGMKAGADFVEARLAESTSNGFFLNNGKMEISGFGTEKGIGIKIMKGGRESFFSSNIMNKEEIRKGIEKSLIYAKTFPSLMCEIELSKEKSYKKSYSLKEKVPLTIDVSEKIKILKDVERELKKQDHIPTRQLSLSDIKTDKYITNSNGSTIFSSIPYVSFFWFLTVERNGKTMQKYRHYAASSGYEMFKMQKPDQDAIENVKTMKTGLEKGKKCNPGVYDVVLGQELVGIATHESVGHPYEADRMFGREAAQAGESFVTAGMKGTKIGSPVVTVYDDPTIPNSAAYYLYDEECVKARRKTLIKNGVINEFLLNKETAAKIATQSNGSARASEYDKEALIRMSNSYVGKGDYKDEEVFEGIKNGIYIKSFMEWNIDDKRFNQKYVGSEAYEIKNGKIGNFLLNPALEITTPKFWSSIDAVGKDIQFFSATCGKGEPMQAIPVSMGGPHVRLRNVMIK